MSASRILDFLLKYVVEFLKNSDQRDQFFFRNSSLTNSISGIIHYSGIFTKTFQKRSYPNVHFVLNQILITVAIGTFAKMVEKSVKFWKPYNTIHIYEGWGVEWGGLRFKIGHHKIGA